jgi:hypothetical protein
MGIKYLKNIDDATIVCKIPSDKNKAFIFPAKKIDKRNNIVISNGYTEISEADLELLRKESNTFQYYEEAQKLVTVDSLPPEAMSSEQLVFSLREENDSLRAQIAELKEGGESVELKEALAKIEELEKTNASLEDQIVALAEEE